MDKLFNNRSRNGMFWGTVIGTSLGVILTSKMMPLNRKRIMRTARRVRTNLKDGMNSLWN